MHANISRRSLRAVLCLLGLLLLAAIPPQAEAATYVITKTEDDNGPCTPDDCALREAVIAANATPEADRIELPAGVYTLTLPDDEDEYASLIGDLDIVGDLEIAGDPSAPTIIQATTDSRVVEIGFSEVTFSHVEITGGRQVHSSESSVFGGCVRMIHSDVTFVDSAITDCYCLYEGGGLAIQAAAVTFINSTVSGNVSDSLGGGIFQSGIHPEHSITLINSTISGNRARLVGGALSTHRRRGPHHPLDHRP